ncbi:YceD family protein [Sphingomonas glaciei]|uniref:DUF177 domain-containing protein n=1 Tax=Sphingomonas glaciei TaxID=2938948 RepID=A0ABY5MT48_9SPHN|nr:DUF177 domain-containing protein [Sphingomonas glaciei]UUR07237.1 DUF177 domain-containing protein [Sphingomonas glaciei]
MSGAKLPLAKLRDGQRVEYQADEAERAAVADRLDLLGLERLEAVLTLKAEGDRVRAEGQLRASVTQACVASGEPVPATVDAPIALLFMPEPSGTPDEEVELSAEDLDVIFHDGREIDLAAAVADELSLALDPYPRSARAEDALKEAGVLSEEQAGPFAALAALKGK